eukprot:scaffold332239_cov58-Attheya_sp.AAC.1
MIADFFTKQLQGGLFKKFRDFIMNADPSTNSSLDRRSVLGEIKDPKDPNGTQSVRFANDCTKTDGTANDHETRRSKKKRKTNVLKTS